MWPLNNFPQQHAFANKSSFHLPLPNSHAVNPFLNFAPAKAANESFQLRPWAANQPSTVLPWMNFGQPSWPDFGFSNIKPSAKEDAGKGTLSGNFSISGNTFRSLDRETWTPSVAAGKSYNLLSTGNLQVNGAFSTSGGETILSQLGIQANGAELTLAADGTLRINGEEYKKGRNDMSGALKRDGNTYTLTTAEGYVFTLRANAETGVSMRVAANNVAAGAGGLLGSANDGEKDTEKALRSNLKPRDFEVEDVLTFENTKTSAKNDPDRGATLWASRNPKFEKVELKIGETFSYSADGKQVADWKMNALKTDKSYLLFSEEDLSVSGTFAASADGKSQGLKTVSLVIDGIARKVQLNAHGNIEVRDKAGEIVKVPGLTGRGVFFPAVNEDGESYTVGVTRGPNGTLNLSIQGKNVGANDTRSGGLLGDAVGVEPFSGNDDNGAGILRNEDGGLSKPGDKMRFALREFELGGEFDTESVRGACDVAEALEADQRPGHTTYDNLVGRTWGDPHFIGADGELYDVQGKAGTIYNIVSDQGVQVNSLFGKWGGSATATVMKKLGFSVNGRQLEVGIDEAKREMTYKLDGKELTAANAPSWISFANNQVTIESDNQGERWKFTVDFNKHDLGDYLDLKSKALRIDNHVESAGIWGHSIGKNDLYKLNPGVYQAGGGGILRNTDGSTLAFDKKEGSAEHTAALANYTETGLFSTSSFWSKFDR